MIRVTFQVGLALAACAVCFAAPNPVVNVCPQAKADGGSISGSANTGYENNVPSQGTCNLAIVIGNNCSVTTVLGNSVPYDGSDDQLIGVVNNSANPISSITLSSPGATPPIFAFDGDGICAYALLCSSEGSQTVRQGSELLVGFFVRASRPTLALRSHSCDVNGSVVLADEV